MDNRSIMVLNTPCFPKRNYHAGNSVSQIITDIIYRYIKLYKKEKVKYVCHAWNLHGKIPEKLYQETVGSEGNYEEILGLSQKFISIAEREKSFFVDYNLDKNKDLIRYLDTDVSYAKFCKKTFYKLLEDNWLREIEGEYYLDLEKFFKSISFTMFKKYFDGINIIPDYHKNSILNLKNTIDKYYPVTKRRVFSILLKEKLSLSPIFQSWLMPIYISTKENCQYPVYFQASSSGRAMLKWHYIRTILSLIIKNDVPYKHLFLHGSILDSELKPMSKHSPILVQPSDLHLVLKDKSFVRYALIKSISYKDIRIQTSLAKSEFLKISKKVAWLKTHRKIYLKNCMEVSKNIDSSLLLLDKFLIKQAFEQFYLALKKSDFDMKHHISQKEKGVVENLQLLYKIFLEPGI